MTPGDADQAQEPVNVPLPSSPTVALLAVSSIDRKDTTGADHALRPPSIDVSDKTAGWFSCIAQSPSCQ
ncbi:hypothetical protein XAR_3643 [Xanthomonas citri pv. glycines str. 8ra]|nr:hypothetical protein XAR_3643 [Xanthomonas citri pv. glycines str. 8ra]